MQDKTAKGEKINKYLEKKETKCKHTVKWGKIIKYLKLNGWSQLTIFWILHYFLCD